jgi:DNA-directed RNA polymerase subunit delta
MDPHPAAEELIMGGHQVPSAGSGDDGFDEEGYDESQRAEILEVTRDGPTDGVILTNIAPDLGLDDPEDEPIDDLDMDSEEIGETDSTVTMDEDDQDEDDLQDALDDGSIDDDELGDADDIALRP